MTATINLNGLTHFAPAPSHPEGWYIAYKEDSCEKCGEVCYNDAEASPNLKADRKYLESLGMKFSENLPPEMIVDFHDEDGGDEEWGCSSCM